VPTLTGWATVLPWDAIAIGFRASGRQCAEVHPGWWPRSAVVDVADTGAGIAPEHLPRLFDRFYRADAASSRAAGSTGLGLTIAKMLVDAHAGELYLASTLGAGTVASVRLPLAAQPAPVSYRLRELVTPAAPR
jgi:signal transduction histidine kinase